jgi:hypothetical protein
MPTLKRASKSRPSGTWSDDDYDVFDGDLHIGRILWTHAATRHGSGRSRRACHNTRMIEAMRRRLRKRWRILRRSGSDKNERGRQLRRPLCSDRRVESYLSWVEMLVKVALSWVPRVLTAAMIATEMPAAIRPYSMAVAPELSFKKRRTSLLIGWFQCCPIPETDFSQCLSDWINFI